MVMFTGLVQTTGTIGSLRDGRLAVRARVDLSPGDSVAVNGVCLTASAAGDDGFEADVMPETLRRTVLGALEEGDSVNLELPLRASDRLGGHVVQGHVDGTATVADVTDDGFAKRLRVELPDQLLPY